MTVGQGLLVGFLLAAAAGKWALIPFSGWLPRAMEGPTPSSAVFYRAAYRYTWANFCCSDFFAVARSGAGGGGGSRGAGIGDFRFRRARGAGPNRRQIGPLFRLALASGVDRRRNWLGAALPQRH